MKNSPAKPVAAAQPLKNFLSELEGRTLVLREISPAAGGVNPPREFRVLALGASQTRDGRTVDLDAAGAAAAVQSFAAGGTDLPIDYEHQTQGLVEYTDPKTKQPVKLDYRSPDGTAPAAGWGRLESRADGLWLTEITWTDKAQRMLSAREYRYFSPVITAPGGNVIGIKSVALTNRPALTNLDPLVASDAASGSTTLGNAEVAKEDDMFEKLLEALGLPATATEDEVLAKVKELCAGAGAALTAMTDARATLALTDTKPEAFVTALKSVTADAAVAKSVRGVLKLAPAAPEAEVLAAVVALTARPDASVAADLAALKERLASQDAAAAVDAAMKAGKVPPALKDWALTEAKERPTQFAQFVEKATPVVPLDGIETAALSDRANAGSAAAAIPAEIRRQFPSLTDADLKQG